MTTRNTAEPVFPEILREGDLLIVMGIGRKRRIHILALCQDRRFVQYEIKLPIRFFHRKGQRQDFPRRHGQEIVSIHCLLYGVDPVIADESTVRLAGSQRLEA